MYRMRATLTEEPSSLGSHKSDCELAVNRQIKEQIKTDWRWVKTDANR